MILLKTKKELSFMQESGAIVGEVLHQLKQYIVEGVTTEELDSIAESIILKHNAIPAFKGYRGFPYTICASVNSEVVHGFPNKKKLKYGDIVTVDVGSLKNRYYGDAAVTYCVGEPTPEIKKLLTTTKQCLLLSIEQLVPACTVGDVANCISNLASSNGFITIKEYGGHGIGRTLHEAPFIPNHGKPNFGFTLYPGTAIAIEPILTCGTDKIHLNSDGWTVVTNDGSLAAHFEHTVFLDDNGPIILTRYE